MEYGLDIGGTAPRHGLGAGDYLRQEIAYFERRLREMGDEGDCAYERALTRVYRLLLKERRDQLTALNSDPGLAQGH